MMKKTNQLIQSQSAIGTPMSFKDGIYLHMTEIKKYHYFEITFWGATKKQKQKILNVKNIPQDTRNAYTENHSNIYMIAPNTYFIASLREQNYHQILRKHENSQKIALTDLSHAITQISITGRHVNKILERIAAIDMHDKAFPNHAFAQTQYHHVKILIHKITAENVQLYIPRSYARAIAETLNQSAIIIKKQRINNMEAVKYDKR